MKGSGSCSKCIRHEALAVDSRKNVYSSNESQWHLKFIYFSFVGSSWPVIGISQCMLFLFRSYKRSAVLIHLGNRSADCLGNETVSLAASRKQNHAYYGLFTPSKDKLAIARDFGAPTSLLATSRYPPVPFLLKQKDAAASCLHKGGGRRQISLPSWSPEGGFPAIPRESLQTFQMPHPSEKGYLKGHFTFRHNHNEWARITVFR
jgi:hypothetical protein